MMTTRAPKKLIEETKVIARFYLFLRYSCGLKVADMLSAKQLRQLFCCLTYKKIN